jgi:hypothetical protein
LDLLRFPCDPFLSVTGKWKSSWWIKGKQGKATSSDRNKLIKEKLPMSFNKLSLSISNVHVNFYETPFDFDGTFHVSPTSQIWDTVWEYNLDQIESEQIRMSFESQECSLRANNITQYPSLYEFILPLNTHVNPDEVLHDLLFPIARSFSNADISCAYRGGFDLITSLNDIRFNTLQTLAPWSQTYQMIGDYIDKLRSIMIVPLSIGEEIKKRLHLSDDSICMIPSSYSHQLTLVHIPQSTLKNIDQHNSLVDLCIRKDATTKSFEMGRGEGEYKTSQGAVFVNGQRMNDLIRKKIMPRIKESDTLFLIIPQKYCDYLKIDATKMIVWTVNKQWAKMFDDQLDLFFAQTPSNLLPNNVFLKLII